MHLLNLFVKKNICNININKLYLNYVIRTVYYLKVITEDFMFFFFHNMKIKIKIHHIMMFDNRDKLTNIPK